MHERHYIFRGAVTDFPGVKPLRVPSTFGGDVSHASVFAALLGPGDRVLHGGRLLQRHGVGDPRGRAPVFPDDEHVGLGGRDRRRRARVPPEQVPVEVLAESAADQVQGDWVDARVDEAQTEPDDPQDVPERVVLLRGPGIVVEPQHEHVMG